MAFYVHRKKSDTYQAHYNILLNKKSKRKTKSTRTKPEVEQLVPCLEQLEQATRMGVARREDIFEWIDNGWLTGDEAAAIFDGFTDALRAHQRRQQTTQGTDYDMLLDMYDEYVEQNSKSNPRQYNQRLQAGKARRVVQWLQSTAPYIGDLTVDDIRAWRTTMRSQKMADWTIHHQLTALRIIIDQAMRLGWVDNNVAREVSLKQPRTQTERRILTGQEVEQVMEASLRYRQWMNGGLPTVVRLGLYAGLRNEEMVWLKWESIDWSRRILVIERQVDPVTGASWVPKDHELRRLDVKRELTEYLKEERNRQEDENLISEFVLPAGGTQNKSMRTFLGRPLDRGVPQKSFGKMVAKEKLNPSITVYSLRHTYCTFLLRAGVDIRTVQHRMGHASITTTQQYLHYLEPEQHPTDALPY